MGMWEPSQGASDEWYTPAYIFDALGETFDLDVASTNERWHVPTKCWLTERDNGLRYAPYWQGFIWMNPPFGGRDGVIPWLSAFFAHSGGGIALTPDRTSAGWFQKAWPRADLAMFLPKVKFYRPDGSIGRSPGNGTCLWANGPRGCAALRRAAGVGLGILASPA